eukprot:TRINITY_DN66192_c8_g3_i2.p1 TRINITY_DN66192_c8_g3~~TRINITY_DN66192_c8_g3_i2.p1  ORF type:complete len:308 (+),score=166.46 TRINITY_DN66192_c8_g3_i2:227-1150(+)
MVDPDSKEFDSIYMVMEFMETDLHKIIYSKNKLSDEHIQYFVYQILSGLKYMHSANVLHRDLKPGNILLNSDCELKICDFGLARGVTLGSDQDYSLTEYVVTRWYRAPEVMVACQEYDFKLDVWSVGCIFAELMMRDPLFPGEDYIHQMKLIFDVLGTPSSADMDFVTNDHARKYIQGLKKSEPKDLSKLIPGASPLAIDLLQKMLKFNPEQRISVDDALKHPYLAELVDELSNHTVTSKVHFNFEWEKTKMTKRMLQDFILGEVCKFRPQCAKRLGWSPPDEVAASNRGIKRSADQNDFKDDDESD